MGCEDTRPRRRPSLTTTRPPTASPWPPSTFFAIVPNTRWSPSTRPPTASPWPPSTFFAIIPNTSGGTSARLGLDSETPWLWGLSVAPPSKEGLGVIHRSNQELGIFWPHEEASASVIGGTQRWGGEGRRGGGGESQILEDPAQFLKTVIVSSQLIWKLRRSSQLSLSTFTFCNIVMKNDLGHSLFVYHLKRMRLHRKLVKYMFQNLSMWGSFVQCNRKRYQ